MKSRGCLFSPTDVGCNEVIQGGLRTTISRPELSLSANRLSMVSLSRPEQADLYRADDHRQKPFSHQKISLAR